jgi:tRNA U55 pseudouridine synthase TruB
MGALTRVRSGNFSVESAITLAELKRAVEEDRLVDFLFPVEKALPFPHAEIKKEFISRAVNGNPVAYDQLISISPVTGTASDTVEPFAEGEKFWLYGGSELIGLYQSESGVIKLLVMIAV